MKFRGSRLKEGYFFLGIFIILLVTGVLAKIFLPNIWEWFGIVDTASAVSLAALAFLGYLEYIRSEDEVELVFEIEGRREPTEYTILRKNFTRGEVLGVLGMIPANQKERFELQYTQSKEFLKDVHKIQKGKEKEFIIPMSYRERKQFNI